jgi:hypothetical protein
MTSPELDRQSTLRKLQRMSEKALRQRILLPLLQKYDFTHLEERHGPHERGVDILCLRRDEMGDLDIVVIQAKRLQFSGATSSKGHLHALLNQLSQCLMEPAKLPDGTARVPTRIWFVSPFPLEIVALEASFAAFSGSFANRIKVIDGPKLIAVLQQRAPELLAQLGDRYALYLKRLEDELVLIQEASAFRLRDKTSVLPFYVRLDLSLLSERVADLISINRSARPELILSVSTLREKISAFEFATDPILKAPALVDLHACANRTLDILSHTQTSIAVEEVQNGLSLDGSDSRLNIDAETLLRSKLNFQIVGLAGGGKTTLLRVLGHREAVARTGRIPIFVSLAATDAKKSILSRIQDSCSKYGLPTSKQSVYELFEAGKALLLLDGVDEAISGRAAIHSEVLQLMTQFKNTQCVFSARGWAALPPNRVFCTATLRPFTPDQVREFLSKWFEDQPNHALEIIQHLEKNPELYAVISTPLVATIFAVVKVLGGTLPGSLIELYEERLRLLLHDWDAARGIKRDQFRAQDKRFFLRKLAFRLHQAGIRTLPWREIVSQIQATVGEIKTVDVAKEFARELVNHNNLLHKDPAGNWGLGHLQYQEHLAALEARENPAVNLASFIFDGWWRSVLAMYAGMTGDIAPLISKVYEGHEGEGFSDKPKILQVLRQLIKLAPNTGSEAKHRVEKDWEIYTSVKQSFDQVPDEWIVRGIGKPKQGRG